MWVAGLDRAGNIGLEDQQHRIVIDITAPVAVVMLQPPSRVNDASTVTVLVGGADAITDRLAAFTARLTIADDPLISSGSPIFHNIDLGVFDVPTLGSSGSAAATAILVEGPLEDGRQYTVSANAIDIAGNVGEENIMATFAVDVTPPVAVLQATSPTYSNVTSRFWATVGVSERGCTGTLKLIEDETDALLQIVDAATVDRTANFDAYELSLQEGKHRGEVEMVDAAGNPTIRPLTFEFWIDSTAPRVDVVTSLSGTAFTADAALLVNASCIDASPCVVDAVSTASVVQDIMPDGSVSLTLSVAASAWHTARVVVSDAAANIGVPHDITWYYDVTPPDLSAALQLSRGTWQLNTRLTPANDDSIDLQVTNEPVSALTAGCDDPDGSLCVIRVRLELIQSARTGCVPTSGDPASDDRSASSGSGVEDSARDAATAPYQVWTDVAELSIGELRVNAVDVPLPPLIDGTWRILLATVDEAGHVQDEGAAHSWSIDSNAPSAGELAPNDKSIDSVGATGRRSVVWEFTLLDFSPLAEHSRVMWTLDDHGAVNVLSPRVTAEGVHTASIELGGGTSTAISEPGAGSSDELADGRHTLRAWLVDAAGNDGTLVERSWDVEGDPPDTHIMFGPASRVGRDIVYVDVIATTSTGEPLPNATFEATMDGVNWLQACDVRLGTAAGGCRLSAVGDEIGTIYNLQVRAVNALGTEDRTPATVSWTRSACGEHEWAVVDPVDAGIVCEECDEGADCADPMALKGHVYAKDGFWRAQVPTDTTGTAFEFCESRLGDVANSVRCYRRTHTHVVNCPRADECLLPGACVGKRVENGTIVPSGCAEGFTGRLCSMCADGYFMQVSRSRQAFVIFNANPRVVRSSVAAPGARRATEAALPPSLASPLCSCLQPTSASVCGRYCQSWLARLLCVLGQRHRAMPCCLTLHAVSGGVSADCGVC